MAYKLTEEDRKRFRGQKFRILEQLSFGPKTNIELSVISLKYTGRISELRQAGYDIRHEEVAKGTGLFRYTLHGLLQPERPAEQRDLFGAKEMATDWSSTGGR